MLRLANIDSKELKDSLRYVEMQLAKTKENLRETNLKLEQKTDEVMSCHQRMQD